MAWSRGLLLVLSLAPALEARAQRSAPEPVEAAEEARARAYFTDTELVTQDGRPVRFFSDAVKGRVVCLSFIFSRCSGACPLLAQKLNRVRQDLGDRFGRDVFFLSITVDPEFDTPQQLRRFAEKQQALHPGWTFLTGTRAAVQTVLTKLGAWVEEPGDHSTAFIAGNARTRHWVKVRPDLSPGAVAEVLRQLADEAPAAEKPVSAAAPSAPR